MARSPHVGFLTVRASYLKDYTTHVLVVGFIFGVNNYWSDGVMWVVISSHPLCAEHGGEFLQTIPHVR